MASQNGCDSEAEKRRRRLATALRENLKRRKTQQRGRDTTSTPQPAPDQLRRDEIKS